MRMIPFCVVIGVGVGTGMRRRNIAQDVPLVNSGHVVRKMFVLLVDAMGQLEFDVLSLDQIFVLAAEVLSVIVVVMRSSSSSSST